MRGHRLEIDANDWRVPNRDTVSYHVYNFLRAGKETGEIADILGVSPNCVRVTKWKIVHPARANTIALATYHRRKHKSKTVQELTS